MPRRKVTSRRPNLHPPAGRRPLLLDPRTDVSSYSLIDWLQPLGDAALAGLVDVVQPPEFAGTTTAIAIHAFKCPMTAKEYLRMTAKTARDLHEHGFITDWDGIQHPSPEEEAPESNTGPKFI